MSDSGNEFSRSTAVIRKSHQSQGISTHKTTTNEAAYHSKLCQIQEFLNRFRFPGAEVILVGHAWLRFLTIARAPWESVMSYFSNLRK